MFECFLDKGHSTDKSDHNGSNSSNNNNKVVSGRMLARRCGLLLLLPPLWLLLRQPWPFGVVLEDVHLSWTRNKLKDSNSS